MNHRHRSLRPVTKYLQLLVVTSLPLAVTCGSASGLEVTGETSALKLEAMEAFEAGSCEKAVGLIRSAISLLPDPENAEAVVLWKQIGEAEQGRAHFTEAEQDYRQAIAISEKLQPPQYLETAACLNDLATIAHARGQFAGAEKFLRQSYSLLEKDQAVTGAVAGAALSNLGMSVGSRAGMKRRVDFMHKPSP